MIKNYFNFKIVMLLFEFILITLVKHTRRCFRTIFKQQKVKITF